jgi:hypothetical protein
VSLGEMPFGKLRSVLLLLFALGALSLPAFSQNCALCYTQAASTGARMIHALQSGILILVTPPTCMSVALLFIVHHKRNQVRRPETMGKSGQDW